MQNTQSTPGSHSWLGVWKNQYGSELNITSEQDGRVTGTFTSAVDTSFKGETPVSGFYTNELIALAVGSSQGYKIVTYTGILRYGRMETLWHVAVNDKPVPGSAGETRQTGIWEAFVTGADTFERNG